MADHVIPDGLSGKFRNGPQLVGADGGGFLRAQDPPDLRFHSGVGKAYLLDDTAQHIAVDAQGADQAVLAHGQGEDGVLAQAQGDLSGVLVLPEGGVLPVGADQQLSNLSGQTHGNVLGMEARGDVHRGHRGPQGSELLLQDRV